MNLLILLAWGDIISSPDNNKGEVEEIELNLVVAKLLSGLPNRDAIKREQATRFVFIEGLIEGVIIGLFSCCVIHNRFVVDSRLNLIESTDVLKLKTTSVC
jgi:hypothetical protein